MVVPGILAITDVNLSVHHWVVLSAYNACSDEIIRDKEKPWINRFRKATTRPTSSHNGHRVPYAAAN
jgi:hypothetical protein